MEIEKCKQKKRTDIVYDGVELGLVPCGEEDVVSGACARGIRPPIKDSSALQHKTYDVP
jgi:hypothetical protein